MIHLDRNKLTSDVDFGAHLGNTPRSQNSATQRRSGGDAGGNTNKSPSPAKSKSGSYSGGGSIRRTKPLDTTPPAIPPTRHLVVDHKVLQDELDALHDDIFECATIPPALREECTDLLQEVNRLLTLDHIRFTERESQLSSRAGTPGSATPKSATRPSLSGSKSPGLAASRPLQQPWGTVNSDKLRKSWKKLVAMVKSRMSEEELSLLSLPTIRDLMHYYVLDRDPVEIANVELYWRALAQQREDERNKKALPHKSCGATPQNVKGPAREISKQYASPKAHQRADGAGSIAGSASPSRMSPTNNGSFRVR